MVIISSFYNEEYMLPWWLEHHKSMFRHGVLFDYYSTDRSVEIIKTICPTWDVIPTQNKDWDPRTNDKEFVSVEKETPGYKIVLTTTEFLVGDMTELSEQETAYEIPIIRMVDTEPDIAPTYNKPLLEQKATGYHDKSHRRRFLHNYPDGLYNTGRDRTEHETTLSDFRVYKYEFSPWTEEFKKRRLQMKDYMSPEHLMSKNWGSQHKLTDKELEEQYKDYRENAELQDFKEHVYGT